jgi:Clp amino terminal domain, pathogenicity island component
MLDEVEAEPTLARLVRAVETQRGSAAPLERLATAVELAERVRSTADELVDHFVQSARAAGCSWTEIGGALGVTKQAAQQRFVNVATPDETWPPGLDAAAGAAFARAANEARALGHHYVGPEHLLLGLLAQPEELAARALEALGVTPEAVRARVVERLRPAAPRPGGSLGVAPQTKRLLELARTLAKRLGHRCARTEHVLLAAVSPALKSPAGTVLAECGADARAYLRSHDSPPGALRARLPPPHALARFPRLADL